jgi:hypothetical protein
LERVVVGFDPLSLDELVAYPFKTFIVADHVPDKNLLVVLLLLWHHLVKALEVSCTLANHHMLGLHLAITFL